MNDDFVEFFEVSAEEMYMAQKLRSYYKALLKEVESTTNATGLATWLMSLAQKKTEELVTGSMTRNSTSEMANYAHLLNLKAVQEQVRELKIWASFAKQCAE